MHGVSHDALAHLVSLYGIETSYWDILNRRQREAQPETLLGVARALGAAVERFDDIPAAIRERRQAQWRQLAPPVMVAWEGRPAELELRLPAALGIVTATCTLRLETGATRRWRCPLVSVPTLETVEVEGARFTRKRLPLAGGLPWGYHRLRLEIGKQRGETLVIAAPVRAYGPAPDERSASWGVFLPLYALHSKRSWGVGDLTDLKALMRWVESRGGDLVGTLPLLAAFLDEPFEPCPYVPASRLFWNELYLDLTRIPEFARGAKARGLTAAKAFAAEREELAAAPLVDYRRALALKRRVLEELARCFFARPGRRAAAFKRYLAAHPEAEDYARFRATVERRGTVWAAWPARLREGKLRAGDWDEPARRYHLYAQWQTEEQMEALGGSARAAGTSLYLDLPLGVHRASYDVWRARDAFALGAAGGAPPDPVFTSGQNWEFPPLHPERLRAQGYRYFIACLRHEMQHAGLLRIDHVMGLHHLFWIPQGAAPGEGAYVQYPAEELYAILCLESHRHRTALVGENLGLVPGYVNPTMTRHNISKMYIVQFELASDPGAALRPVPSDAVAAFNTHDMYPVAAYWEDRDITDRLRLGLLDEARARQELAERAAIKFPLVSFLRQGGWLEEGEVTPAAVFRACARYLAASPARAVILNLEDLWGETEPQNVPGTSTQRPNWKRKARHALEAFRRLPEVEELLAEVNARRARLGGQAGARR